MFLHDALNFFLIHRACVATCATNTSHKHMAKLGLTCKDALEVFSQNETLKLQGQVTDLTQQLGVYELPERFKFEAAQADELIKQCAKSIFHYIIDHSEDVMLQEETVHTAPVGDELWPDKDSPMNRANFCKVIERALSHHLKCDRAWARHKALDGVKTLHVCAYTIVHVCPQLIFNPLHTEVASQVLKTVVTRWLESDVKPSITKAK